MFDPNAGERRAGRFGRPTVVIVDAESLYRWFVAESLGQEGMSVLQFKNLADAAGQFDRRALPRLVLVDAQTMNDEGAESLHSLRRRLPTLHCLVLEPAGPGIATSTIDGVSHTPKPVDSDALRSLVHTHLEYAA